MASLIDITALSLATEEAQAVGEVVSEKIYNNETLQQAHAIFTGIAWDTQIPFAGLIGRNLAKVVNCNMPAGTGFSMSEKTWTPVDVGVRYEHCQQDLDQLFKLFGPKTPRYSADDITGTDIADFIVNRIEAGVAEDLHRLIYFGDTAMDIVSNGGYLANALDGEQAVWQAFDGLWKQWLADGAIPVQTISENGLASYAAQLALGATTAYDTFKGMYEKADSRMLSVPGLRIECTRSLFMNYQAWLEDKSLAFTLERTERGTSRYTFRGIPIVVRNDWDRSLVLFDNGTKYDKPHRAALTVPGNKPLGILDQESLTQVSSFYVQKDLKNYMDVLMRMDVKHLESYMIVCAY